MRRRWLPWAVVAALLAPAACSDDGPGEGEARLDVDGMVDVERADGDREQIDDGTTLRAGDRVTVTDGVALMRLAGGSVLELRKGFGDAASSMVLMARRPVLEAGEVLVTTPDRVSLEADGTDVQVTDGAARVNRDFGMSVAAYDADVDLDSAGVLAEVPALRQMVVPDLGRPPQNPRPITYDPQDTWDLRFLGAAMDLGNRLEDLAQGLTNTLPDGQGRTPGFFKLVLPGLEDEAAFDAELLEPHLDREPGQTLIGAAISDLGERSDFVTRWNQVFDFHDAGAAWGIVALDQAVRSAPLVGSVEEALDTSFEEAAFVQPPAEEPATTPTTRPSGGEAPPEGGGTDGGPVTTPPTSPPPSTPPPTTPVTPPVVPEVPEPLAPVVDPVTDLLDDLLGGLLGGLRGGGG